MLEQVRGGENMLSKIRKSISEQASRRKHPIKIKANSSVVLFSSFSFASVS